MRVLLVNYEYPELTENCGGGGRVTELLRDGLEDRGHQVRVITDGGDASFDPGLHGPDPGHYASFPFRARGHISAQDEWADVIHGHFSLPSSLSIPAFTSSPFVCSVFGADVYDPTRYKPIRPLADLANRYILGRADAVLTPSSDMEERVRRKYGLEPQTVHLGIDPTNWEWTPRDRDDTLRILSVGRLVERKNLFRACNAVRDLAENGYDVEYRIVGTGPLEDELSYFDDYDWFERRGYVDDLQAEHDWADVFFLPSHHESFGLVFLEALSSGLPVVASTCGGQTDIVSEDVGALGDPDDPWAMIDALQAVDDDYGELQSNTEGYVDEHFSAAKMVEEYAAVYEAVT